MSKPLELRTILVPMDFSPHAKRALEVARALGERTGPTHLILVHAQWIPPEVDDFVRHPDDSLTSRLSEQAAETLAQLLIGLQDAGISSEYIVLRGRPEQVIVDLAREKSVDLIVMGTHGRTGLGRLALGSIAERVVREAHSPVMTVRGAVS